MRVFRTKAFARFARREHLEVDVLVDAVRRAELGLVEAHLGGGLIKQRVARRGGGRSGGFRTIVAYRRGDLAFFIFGFAKNARANISVDELSTLKELSASFLAPNGGKIDVLLSNGEVEELPYD